MIEDDENQSPEYYDLYDDLNERLCEENEEPEEDKVCCSEDDIEVIVVKKVWGSGKYMINIDNVYYLE